MVVDSLATDTASLAGFVATTGPIGSGGHGSANPLTAN